MNPRAYEDILMSKLPHTAENHCLCEIPREVKVHTKKSHVPLLDVLQQILEHMEAIAKGPSSFAFSLTRVRLYSFRPIHIFIVASVDIWTSTIIYTKILYALKYSFSVGSGTHQPTVLYMLQHRCPKSTP